MQARCACVTARGYELLPSLLIIVLIFTKIFTSMFAHLTYWELESGEVYGECTAQYCSCPTRVLLSCMAAGQVSLELEAHEETQESNSKAATEKDLRVRLCCSVTLPPVIQAHTVRIVSVLHVRWPLK